MLGPAVRTVPHGKERQLPHRTTRPVHFIRYRVALRADLTRREQGDWKATGRALRTEREYEELRCGKKASLGNFKCDANHWLVFATLWNLGITELSSEELADLFDWFCPCRKDHLLDALKNQRARFSKGRDQSPRVGLVHIHHARRVTCRR